MAKRKTFEVELKWSSGYYLDGAFMCYDSFLEKAKPLCKGMYRGQTRRLRLTWLKKGIKIERID